MKDVFILKTSAVFNAQLFHYPVARVSLARMSLFSSFVTSIIPGVSIFCLIQLHCSNEFMNMNSTPMWPQYADSSRFKISRNGSDFSLPPINVVDGNLKTRSMSDSSISRRRIKKQAFYWISQERSAKTFTRTLRYILAIFFHRVVMYLNDIFSCCFQPRFFLYTFSYEIPRSAWLKYKQSQFELLKCMKYVNLLVALR